MTADRALTISTVYRAISILATAGSQLSITVNRGDVEIPTPSTISRPSLACSRSAFIEETITSLATDGNAFWKHTFGSDGRTVIDSTVLNPTEVAVLIDPRTDAITYAWRGRTFTPKQIKHLKLLRLPGHSRGLGPIQAAQIELTGAIAARDYGALWFNDAGVPNGILRSDQELSPAQAELYKRLWHNLDPVTGEPAPTAVNRHQVRVLGKGLAYEPNLIKPADAQFLESQQFSTTQIARLFGTPSSLMLAAVEGQSNTYSNVEQDWIAFVRFTLMSYLTEIEEALTETLPTGQSARFKLEALLRSDTKTRYEGHGLAISAGFLDIDEVRKIEGFAPRTAAQIAAHTPAPAPTPLGVIA